MAHLELSFEALGSIKNNIAKECVTTHLPNELALKMDGAEVIDLYRTIGANATPQ